MTSTPKTQIFSSQEWHIYKDLRLRALADSPDAFGSTLAREQGRTDEEWLNRLILGSDPIWDLPLLVELNGIPAGLAWGRIEMTSPDMASLYQLWVAPEYRNCGAGKMLLEAVIAWARERNVHYLELCVTNRDSPAARLYSRAGFQPEGEPQPLRPGSVLMEQTMRLQLRSQDPL